MFTHLHVHSWFSFGLGTSSPDILAQAAVRRGYRALALTDTNGVYGAVEFQRACNDVGIRPILGCHLVTRDHEAVVLAEDAHGWAALCRAVTAIHWHPDLDLSAQLAADRTGLVLLTRNIDLLERLVTLSGPSGIYAELRPEPGRHHVLAAARRLGIPTTVTGGVVCANAEDWNRHRLLLAIHHNTTLAQLGRESYTGSPGAAATSANPWPREAWLRPAADLERHFPDIPEAFVQSGELAERCQYRIPIGGTIAPRTADTDDAFVRLRTEAYEGAMRRYGVVAPVTRDRLEHELGIIQMKGFADYFLIVQEIVQNSRAHCGRGSVANSVVSYCLGITHVEPLDTGLRFERFLNPARTDPPDIDLDFPWDERDKILAWTFRKYPMPRAAMVANHNCLRLAGALREVAKVYGRPAGEIREITRRIPPYTRGPARDVIATHANFRDLRLPKVWQDLAETAESLVGTPRHLSLHAGGVVIVPTALTDVVPIERAAKQLDGYPGLTVPVIQFEKDGAEDAGLVKIDLLGNRSLAVIRDAIAMVHISTGVQLDYTSKEAGDDPATRRAFRTGETLGVFYTESPASRLLNHKSRADTFDLLVLNTSIIRPASNRFIRSYLERLHGTRYDPPHPSLEETLAETFGVMVFQEDVVNVAYDFAGLSWATADGLRKALSKKRPEKLLAGYREEFAAGARALNRDEASIERVWQMTISFAGFSFCKGHSCSYILVAQQSAYLRANHPAEFIAAVLSNGGGFYRPFAYVAEARRMNVTVLPPDVNASEWRCTGASGAMRIGFQFVKGLSSAGATALLTERAQGGLFHSMEELRTRITLSAEDLRLLIKVGACDALDDGLNRPQRLWALDTSPNSEGSDTAAHQGNTVLTERCRITPSLRDYDTTRKRRDAWALLGFCLDAHPMSLHAEELKRFRLVRSTDLAQYVGKRVLMAGMYTTGKPVRTVREEPMQFATFDDGHGLVECVLFPDVYRERAHVLFDQGPFLFRGLVEEEFGVCTVTVQQIERLERMLARMGQHARDTSTVHSQERTSLMRPNSPADTHRRVR